MTLLRKQPDPARKGKFLPSVHFFLPGNVRWNCPVLYANSRLAREVEDLLRGHNAITKVTANPVTGPGFFGRGVAPEVPGIATSMNMDRSAPKQALTRVDRIVKPPSAVNSA